MHARARETFPLPWWLALFGSALAHATLVGLFELYVMSGGHGLRAGGEDGLFGAGGDTIEVTIAAASASSEERPLSAPIATEAPSLESSEETEDGPAHDPPNEERPSVTADHSGIVVADRVQRRRRARRTGEPAEPAPPSAPAETGPAQVGPAEGSDATRQGRAGGNAAIAGLILGSVGLGGGSDSRSLLERAIQCGDPIEGIWVAHRYRPERRDWARMTLRIHREGDALSGTITSRMWTGTSTDRRPPPCGPGMMDHTHRMPAHGTVRGNEVTFVSETVELVRTDCPGEQLFSAYAPDRFRGHLDLATEHLELLNNDLRYEFDVLYRFRRVACIDSQ